MPSVADLWDSGWLYLFLRQDEKAAASLERIVQILRTAAGKTIQKSWRLRRLISRSRQYWRLTRDHPECMVGRQPRIFDTARMRSSARRCSARRNSWPRRASRQKVRINGPIIATAANTKAMGSNTKSLLSSILVDRFPRVENGRYGENGGLVLFLNPELGCWAAVSVRTPLNRNVNDTQVDSRERQSSTPVRIPLRRGEQHLSVFSKDRSVGREPRLDVLVSWFGPSKMPAYNKAATSDIKNRETASVVKKRAESRPLKRPPIFGCKVTLQGGRCWLRFRIVVSSIVRRAAGLFQRRRK